MKKSQTPSVPDWLAAVEKAEAESLRIMPPDPNTFTTAEFAEVKGMSLNTASHRITAMIKAGVLVRAGKRRTKSDDGRIYLAPQYKVKS